jgi:hypothetical protein
LIALELSIGIIFTTLLYAKRTSFYSLLHAGHTTVDVQSATVIHFNHLSDVRCEVDYYHSGPHGTFSSLLVQDLKESSSPGKWKARVNTTVFTSNMLHLTENISETDELTEER